MSQRYLMLKVEPGFLVINLVVGVLYEDFGQYNCLSVGLPGNKIPVSLTLLSCRSSFL